MEGMIMKFSHHRKGFRNLYFPCLLLIPLLLGACASDLDFRRFEVGETDPQLVFDTAVEVVRSFYTTAHGGIAINVDRENLMLETGYIVRRSQAEIENEGARLTTVQGTPSRQKLYLRVIPVPGGADIEFFASYETMDLEDPGKIESPEDMWIFVRQDTQVEDILYAELLEKLVEAGVLD